MFGFNPDDVPLLEQRLLAEPCDLDARVKLLAFYFHGHDADYARHVKWLIANQPEFPFKQHNVMASPSNRQEIEDAWWQAIDKRPSNIAVLRNAIDSASFVTPKQTLSEWRKRAWALEPTNSDWPSEFAFEQYLQTLSETASLEERRKSAAQSAEYAIIAIKLWNPADTEIRGYNEVYRTESMWFEYDLFDAAQLYGEFLVAYVSAQRQNKLDLHLVNLLQKAHSILARVALKRNNADLARKHFYEMPIVADYDFCGDSDLAVALFDAGWSEHLIDYLSRCVANLQAVHQLMNNDERFMMEIYQTHSQPDIEDWLFIRIKDRIELGKKVLEAVQVDAPESRDLLQRAF